MILGKFCENEKLLENDKLFELQNKFCVPLVDDTQLDEAPEQQGSPPMVLNENMEEDAKWASSLAIGSLCVLTSCCKHGPCPNIGGMFSVHAPSVVVCNVAHSSVLTHLTSPAPHSHSFTRMVSLCNMRR